MNLILDTYYENFSTDTTLISIGGCFMLVRCSPQPKVHNPPRFYLMRYN